MSSKNVNKKVLIIISALIILMFINISDILFIVLLILFLSPFLISALKFLKDDRYTKKEKLEKSFFNIYWKKNLLFILVFIASDILLQLVISSGVRGFPIPYYSYGWQDRLPSFYPIFFTLDIIFWYVTTSLIIKKPTKMSKNALALNYLVLSVAMVVLCYLLGNVINTEFKFFI